MPSDTCNILREISAAEFVRALRTVKPGAPRVPLAASMDLTPRCNLRCIHCYIRAEHPVSVMSTRQAIAVLDKLSQAGVLFLVLTGGEPLVRPDFRTIYLHAKKCGFVINLFTNGTLIDAETAAFFAANPPRKIEVTMYGYSPGTWRRVTGSTTAYAKFHAGISHLKNHGIRVLIKTMLLRENANEFNRMRRWALRNHFSFRYDALVHARLDGGRAPIAHRLSPGAIARRHLSEPRDRREFKQYLAKTDGHLDIHKRLFECGAGIMTMHVDHTGKAHPCMLWQQDPFDLVRNSLDRRWLNHIAALRKRPAPRGSCRACADRGICNYCPPLALLERGTLSKPAAFHCRLARARRRILGVPRPRRTSRIRA